MKQKFPTLEALATAIAAFAHNQDRVERDAITTADGCTIIPNRQLIREYLEGNRANLHIVSDHDRKHADGVVQYLQQTGIMQTLVSRGDKFLTQINDLLSQPSITAKDFGLMAWAPKLANDYQKKDNIREVSARFEYTSRYIGQVGDKITTEFTLIDSRYIKTMDCYSVYGHDAQGNLIFYWAREQKKIVKAGKIYGRIKTHKRDEYRGDACVTTLNYVKVV
jgi:hypothetical protein